MTNFSTSLFFEKLHCSGGETFTWSESRSVAFCAETELTKVKGIMYSGTCLSGMVLHATVLQWERRLVSSSTEDEQP